MTNGSISSLPEETLNQIFSSNLQQSDLAILCRVSKQFNNIVKPLLYRSITLYTIEQADKFKENKSGDTRLVESILITGKADAWEDDDIMNIYDAIRELTEIEKRKKELGLVKKVVEGEIVNPSQIKSLFIHQVFEDADALWKKDFSVNHQIFANLTDLSILEHRGGYRVLQNFLGRSLLPNLKRLVLCDLTTLTPFPVPIRESTDSLIPTFQLSSDGGVLVRQAPAELDVLEDHLERAISSKNLRLDLLVSTSYDFLIRLPSLLHLAILDCEYSLLDSSKYAVVYISTRSHTAEQIDRVFIHLADIANNYLSYSLQYLALPSDLQLQLSVENRTILNDLTNLGVAVHFDGDLGSVIAPPSFLELGH
ncbi:hypothetical protein JCM3765_004614 [Sporobolomyces pararoseus]